MKNNIRLCIGLMSLGFLALGLLAQSASVIPLRFLAGDDTIFLAARSASAASALTRRLRSLIGPGAKSSNASRSAQPRRSKRS